MGVSTAARTSLPRQHRPVIHPAFNGVSVIIPTWRENPYLIPAVRSVLEQTVPAALVDVIISVNGRNKDFATTLRQQFASEPRVAVVYTARPGLSSGRNFALSHVNRDLLTYLDDDDYFTPGYLADLLSRMTPEVELVCGRLEDERNGTRDAKTYINSALNTLGKIPLTHDYVKAASLLTTAWAKLLRTEFVRDRYVPFCEDVSHTEDVRFWVENFDKLRFPLALVDPSSKEALVRRVTDDSMSRPSKQAAYSFFVTERIKVMKHLEGFIFDESIGLDHKRFTLVKLRSQAGHLSTHIAGLSGRARRTALQEIAAAELNFIPVAALAEKKGIAFCHNFAPFADASAYVAAKRLREPHQLFGEPISWHVVSQDMENLRPKDLVFHQFYARSAYTQLTTLPGKAYFNEHTQHHWSIRALKAVQDEHADVIYSRSMFAGSHEAAYRYKLRHPYVTWVAEFSDPIFLDTNGDRRKPARSYDGEDTWLNDYWRTVEHYVYRLADRIVFTNINQQRVMLANADPTIAERAARHSIVCGHPQLNSIWATVAPAEYTLDHDYINIGYFGTFYPNRDASGIAKLLQHPKTFIHIFTPNPDGVDLGTTDRVRVNSTVDHLQFLSIGSSMDYLVLNDINYPGPLNPYIPSKLADYLATGTEVLALVGEGTILSQARHPTLHLVRSVEEALPLLRPSGRRRRDL